MIKFKSSVLNRFIFAKLKRQINLQNGQPIPIGFHGKLEIKETDKVDENSMFQENYFAPGCKVFACGVIPKTKKIKCSFQVNDTSEWT